MYTNKNNTYEDVIGKIRNTFISEHDKFKLVADLLDIIIANIDTIEKHSENYTYNNIKEEIDRRINSADI